MNDMRKDCAFWLFWDYSHLVDDIPDAELVPFEGDDQVAGWLSVRTIEVPSRIYFEANFAALGQTDFPVNNVTWPLMSRRMADALLAVGRFPHRLVPVVMLDDTVPSDKRFDASGEPLPGVANFDYVVLQVLEHLDAFDWERSEYRPHRRLPGRVAEVNKLVLKEPPGGFPPVFRLAVKSSYLFVSATAKQALDKAGITGLDYLTLDKIVV
jgi:hypothetical protein